MSTKYDPSFKSKLTYERLYQTINKEREKEEPGFDAKEVITRRDQSSILNKLKNQLYFDIKAYAKKSDEEKFNVLKLLDTSKNLYFRWNDCPEMAKMRYSFFKNRGF